MKCLCCGKDIDKNGENGWHKSCIKRFFGASKLPEIEIDDETLKKLADETGKNCHCILFRKISRQNSPL